MQYPCHCHGMHCIKCIDPYLLEALWSRACYLCTERNKTGGCGYALRLMGCRESGKSWSCAGTSPLGVYLALLAEEAKCAGWNHHGLNPQQGKKTSDGRASIETDVFHRWGPWDCAWSMITFPQLKRIYRLMLKQTELCSYFRIKEFYGAKMIRTKGNITEMHNSHYICSTIVNYFPAILLQLQNR